MRLPHRRLRSVQPGQVAGTPLLALRHPATFFGAVSLGGYDAPELGSLAHASAMVRAQATVSHVVRVTDPAHVHLFVAGQDVATDTRAAGGHAWTTWASQLPAALRWWEGHKPGQEVRRASGAPSGASSGGRAAQGRC